MKKFFSGQENEEILRATGLFDGFDRAELETALEFLDAKAFTYEKGACIMLAGNRQACGLVLSGLATGASWLFYFKALQIGEASKVIPVDKFSVVLGILMAFIFLHEAVTAKTLIGGALIAIGTFVLIL